MTSETSLLSTRAVPPRERLIAALDVPSPDDARRLVTALGDAVCFYKLGFELLMSGAYFALADELAGAGKKLFLDLKLYDIPETVGRAMRSLRARRAQFVTVHYGARVLEAACRERGELGILAVTVLTSIGPDDLRDLGYPAGVAAEQLVIERARRAFEIGCEGVVASPLEAARIRAAVGPKLAIVTPGIRPATAADDQRRVATPRAAFESGADYIVVGRPIRDAVDPRGAALAIQETIASVFA
ncbi:MAG: orotidine-5'-phosphate decarboxylase [Proteobacteria bacterium]|nr:MAG: orotidine-5'-phosphate decarboxylase [Pseudomonadota bacterium]